ncbi:putative E3 ubiquitin-protein ligase UBR7 [Mugil cephalus]|uniref:putative E3 ubiquitin-protein ligase UBR7 n=1 Tax=Mugil cephalus TaxID=48193 RepID=UPI001FB79608|nr:putative E3 ubiquitin-protein ligase UBR7 [Mugil cephalus]XP_047466876.1 putative E3 ubiquitin-protein ligase UBR7 [Mugil cephalus]
MAANNGDSDVDGALVTEEEIEQALCVLAGSDPENCSYSQGYVKRQAVFACNTCTPNAAEPAGVCLACANKCHDGHDIFELYTKRNFRCDCGNSKFPDFQCQLNPTKDEENVSNQYNHNFNGCYCTCDRPYPDTDEQDADEMIQCVICEDWFHSRHLGCTVVEPEDLQEMVCEACMNKAPFLWTYAAHFAEPPVISIGHPEEEDVEVNVEEEDCEPCPRREEEPSTSHDHTKQEEVSNRSSPCKRTHEEMTSSPGKAATKAVECKLKELQGRGPETQRRGAVFWPYSWRSELCTCTSCKRAYVAAEVQFLMDQSDTVLAYEKKGLDEPFGQHPLMALTSSMDRVQQLEVIYGFNEMKTSVGAFLSQCASEGKTVTVEAVHQFFEELRARKRRRTNAGYQ